MKVPRSSNVGVAPRNLPQRASGGGRERIENTRHIAVTQAGGLSDLILSLPALEALRAAYPTAELTLLVRDANLALLTGRTGPWTRVLALPTSDDPETSPVHVSALPQRSTGDPTSAPASSFTGVVRQATSTPVDLAVRLSAATGELTGRRDTDRRDTSGRAATAGVPDRRPASAYGLDRVASGGHPDRNAVSAGHTDRRPVSDDRPDRRAASAGRSDRRAAFVDGSGRRVASDDVIVRHLGARVTAGATVPGGEAFDRSIDHVALQHVTLRALEIVGLVGAAPVPLSPRLEVERGDRDRADAALRPFASEPGPLIVMHPGASDPRRRWPTGWFGDIAARAVASGSRIVIVGDDTRGREGDSRLARDVIGEAVRRGADCRRILDLTGRTDLSTLVGLIARADAVVGNDSVPLHLAEAVGTPSVGIFWVGGSITSAPLSRARHRVHIGWTTSCPVCGTDAMHALWTGDHCGHEPSYLTAVPADPIWNDLVDLLAETAADTEAEADASDAAEELDAFDSAAQHDLDAY